MDGQKSKLVRERKKMQTMQVESIMELTERKTWGYNPIFDTL